MPVGGGGNSPTVARLFSLICSCVSTLDAHSPSSVGVKRDSVVNKDLRDMLFSNADFLI